MRASAEQVEPLRDHAAELLRRLIVGQFDADDRTHDVFDVTHEA